MTISTQNRPRFQQFTGIDDQTAAHFDTYAERLAHWQGTINLVGPSTLADPWTRHFLDSAQFWPHLPTSAGSLADIGSGAGFPGLVLAILAAHRGQGGPEVTLIESDSRKAAFLREVSRETGAGAHVVNARAETVDVGPFDVVTARACAPLTKLLPWVHGLLAPGGVALLAKGRQWREELTAATKDWTMTVAEIPSETDTSGVILKLEGLTPH